MRTVVNKTGIVSNAFRTLPLELIAGVAEYDVEVVEQRLRLRFRYDRVYWNSRLAAEHARIVTAVLRRNDVLVDACAGIGPFALPAAAAGVRVYANDLNPASVDACRANARANGVRLAVLANEDARAFIARAFEQRWIFGEGGDVTTKASESTTATTAPASKRSMAKAARKAAAAAAAKSATSESALPKSNSSSSSSSSSSTSSSTTARPTTHFLMNLPASAPELADAFRGRVVGSHDRHVFVHVYGFGSHAGAGVDVARRVMAALDVGRLLDEQLVCVRNVSATQHMYAVRFRLPADEAEAATLGCFADVADDTNVADDAIVEHEDARADDVPASKKQRQ